MPDEDIVFSSAEVRLSPPDPVPMVEIPLSVAEEMRAEIELLRAALWLAAADAVPYSAGAAVNEYLEMAASDIGSKETP